MIFSGVISYVFIAICLGVLCYVYYDARRDIENKQSTNGAHNAVSIGVLFTFIGISFSLYSFDAKNIEASIPLFIEGMKFAFVTSVMGMICSMLIKRYELMAIDREVDNKVENSLASVESIKNELTDIKGDNNQNISDIVAKLSELKKSVDANSIESLSASLSALSDNMASFIDASNKSQDSIAQVSVSMENVSKELADLNDKLTGAIDIMADKQKETLETLSKNMVAAINDSSGIQMKALNEMNGFIKDMAQNSKDSSANARDLLDKTIHFQKDSVDFYESQKQTFDKNNASLEAMKESFDSFLVNMAENYSKELINALNKSMEDLNTQLQSQFGDNFKELNAAVKDVVTWQENYKAIVESTTEELEVLNTSFENFSNKVIPQYQENINIMSAQLTKFTESSSANIAIQDNLHITVEKLADMIVETEKHVEGVKEVFGKFDDFTDSVIKATNDAIEKQQTMMVERLNEYTEKESVVINEGISRMHEGIEHSVQTNIKSVEESMLALQDSYKNYIDSMQETNKVGNDLLENAKTRIETYNETTVKATEKLDGSLKQLVDKFDKSTEDLIKANNDTWKQQQEALVDKLADYTKKENEILIQELKQFSDEINESFEKNAAVLDKTMNQLKETSDKYIESTKKADAANFAMFQDTEQYLKDYNTTTKNAMNEMGRTLEGFREDLKKETADAAATLKVLFEKLAKNTDNQQKQSVEVLAASLGAISNQMITNYNALIKRIAELDALISQKNGGK